MSTTAMQSIWRRLRKPSRATLDKIQKSGAAVDYWPDYTPAKRGAQDRHKQEAVKLPVAI